MKGLRDGDDLDERYAVARIKIERFQEVSYKLGYDYRGYWHTVNCGIYLCRGRVYDDDPSVFTVNTISPPSHGHAVRHPHAGYFSEMILKFLSFKKVQFHDPAGGYFFFDSDTEQFAKQT